MARALHLIQELGCGEVTSTHFDCSAGAPREGKRFTAKVSGINAILGITVPTDVILDILNRLQFEVKLEADGDTMQVVAPAGVRTSRSVSPTWPRRSSASTAMNTSSPPS